MECAKHPGVEAVSFCTNCGTSLCQECRSTTDSRVLCQKCRQAYTSQSEHVRSSAARGGENGLPAPEVVRYVSSTLAPHTEMGDPYCSPGVSLALGMIPGVGAICNGEHWKALLQVLIFGSLISLGGTVGSEDVIPVLRMLAVLMYIYMPLDAYHAARKRVMALRGVTLITPFEKMRFSSLAIGIAAVCLGVIFLVSQFVPETMRFLLRGWPLVLIGIGLYNLTRYFQSD